MTEEITFLLSFLGAMFLFKIIYETLLETVNEKRKKREDEKRNKEIEVKYFKQ